MTILNKEEGYFECKICKSHFQDDKYLTNDFKFENEIWNACAYCVENAINDYVIKKLELRKKA